MASILLATTEAVPFAKTGGLGDVCGQLPIELEKLGHRVTVVMPAFRSVLQSEHGYELTGVEFDVPVGAQICGGEFLRGKLPGSNVPVYFVRRDEFFDRPQLYGEDGSDYRDNCQRFVFFSRAVMESIRLLDLNVDVLHCNDWQTGLVPVLLQAEYRQARGYEKLATIMTIHNLAYQGQFWHWDMLLTGLDWKYFNWRQLEFFGNLNLLKAGISLADAVTTVSPRYAEEIQHSELGCGLESVLYHRRDSLTGILNGVDYRVWNPEQDQLIPYPYGPDNWQEGKAANKAALQHEFGLAQESTAPLFGFVGRLAEQKGADLILEIVNRWASQHSAQWVFLGTGAPELERQLREIAAAYPRRVAAHLGFSEALAHRIEAAADVFLMPSRYEPCGLNQMYSLKYGAVPVVHETGGLADTITNATEENLDLGTANGFSFKPYNVQPFEQALLRARETYHDHPRRWAQLVETGMRQDWSWQRSAQEYIELYEKTISEVKQTVCA